MAAVTSISRSRRFGRGFTRIAVVGSLVGLLAAGALGVGAFRASRADLIIMTQNGRTIFPYYLEDKKISAALVEFAGKQALDPEAVRTLPAGSEIVPYGSEIAHAHSVNRELRDADLEIAGIWLIFAAAWGAFWFAISWIVRGFMND